MPKKSTKKSTKNSGKKTSENPNKKGSRNITLEKIYDVILEMQDDIRGLKKDVSGLKKDVSGLKKDVGGLKKDVAQLKEDVAILKKDVAEIKKDVAELKVKTSSNELRIIRLDKKFEERSAYWESFSKGVDSFMGEIIENRKERLKVLDRIDNHEKRLCILEYGSAEKGVLRDGTAPKKD